MSDRVVVEIDAGVAHVRLNRPEKLNGLDVEMFQAIVAAGEQVGADTSVRAVVLSGEGRSFCAGLDFQSFMAMGQEGVRILTAERTGPANLAQRVAWIWREIPQPVIVALQGHVYGGGLQIALGGDLRYSTADAKLSVMEINLGIIPDCGISKTLPGLVTPDIARELTYTGRIVSGEEARPLGLVTRLCADPVAAALETARTIAARNPHAIRAAKRLWNETPELDTAAAFALETELQLPLLGSSNQLKAVMAKMQRTTPEFEDPQG